MLCESDATSFDTKAECDASGRGLGSPCDPVVRRGAATVTGRHVTRFLPHLHTKGESLLTSGTWRILAPSSLVCPRLQLSAICLLAGPVPVSASARGSFLFAGGEWGGGWGGPARSHVLAAGREVQTEHA